MRTKELEDVAHFWEAMLNEKAKIRESAGRSDEETRAALGQDQMSGDLEWPFREHL